MKERAKAEDIASAKAEKYNHADWLKDKDELYNPEKAKIHNPVGDFHMKNLLVNCIMVRFLYQMGYFYWQPHCFLLTSQEMKAISGHQVTTHYAFTQSEKYLYCQNLQAIQGWGVGTSE